MAQIMRVVDCTTADAKQLADSEALPPRPGLFGHANEDNIQDLVGLLYAERRGSDRQDRVNPWLDDRTIERGVEGGDKCASLSPCQRSNGIMVLMKTSGTPHTDGIHPETTQWMHRQCAPGKCALQELLAARCLKC